MKIKKKREKIKSYIVYTDGSFRNPKYGSWAYVILENNIVLHQDSGYVINTTISRMELSAIIEAIEFLKRLNVGNKFKASIYTDSQYASKSIMYYIKGWSKCNWINSLNKPVANIDLIQKLWMYMQEVKITAHWVRSHSGIYYNEYVDKLAGDMSRYAKQTDQIPYLSE